MKKLYIIRHAKSDWSNPFAGDFSRPLNDRGKKSAPRMGKLLKSKNISPDVILSSPATRAKKTAKKIAKQINHDKKNIIFIEDIYEADSTTLHNIIKSIENKYNTVFLVGHNPGLNMIASEFIDFYENIPTCGIVEIEFDITQWKDVDKKNANFLSFEYPKKYTF